MNKNVETNLINMLENKNIKKTNYNLNYKYLQPNEYDIKLKNPSESTSTKITQKPININTNNNYQEDNLLLSMIPGLGDVIDIINITQDINDKNYKSAALGAGLLLFPNIIEKPLKLFGKNIKNTIKNNTKNIKNINNLKDENFIKDTSINNWGDMEYSNYMPFDQLKNSIEDAKNYIFNIWNNSNNFDNVIKNSKEEYEFYVNPEIKNRIIKSIGKYDPVSYATEKFPKHFSEKKLSYGLADDMDIVALHNKPDGRAAMLNFQDSKLLGYYKPLKEEIMVRFPGPSLPNITQHNLVATHEFTHLMQDKYGIDFSKNSPVYKLIFSSINPTNKWAQNIKEINAELWKYRKLHNIRSRDFTTEEIKDIIKTRPDLFNAEEIINPSDNLIKGLKMLPAIIPGLVISNALINNNKINNVDKKSRN